MKVYRVVKVKRAKFVCPECGCVRYRGNAFAEFICPSCFISLEFEGWVEVEERRRDERVEKLLEVFPHLADFYRKHGYELR